MIVGDVQLAGDRNKLIRVSAGGAIFCRPWKRRPVLPFTPRSRPAHCWRSYFASVEMIGPRQGPQQQRHPGAIDGEA
jgi:hypothetical protein